MTPAGKINFLNVVMHEIAHGLGFSGFGSLSTFKPLAGYQDIYSRFVYDDNEQKKWYDLTPYGRYMAAIGGGLVFRGGQVTAQVPLVLDEKIALRASGTISGDFDFGSAAFSAPVIASNFSGSMALATDTSGATTGCVAYPAGAFCGNIGIVDRGACPFVVKAKNAQNAGATGVIIANNAAGVISMGGDDPTVTVPTVSVSQADGAAIKGGLPGVNVAIAPIPGKLSGTDDAGFARLYAPSTLTPGSTFSHYDTSASPNALMEPNITSTLAANLLVDLTPALFTDEGWTLNPGNAMIDGCDTGVDVVAPGGLIVGANVEASSELCMINAKNRGAYIDCMDDYRKRSQADGLINSQQGGRIMSCAAKADITQ